LLLIGMAGICSQVVHFN